MNWSVSMWTSGAGHVDHGVDRLLDHRGLNGRSVAGELDGPRLGSRERGARAGVAAAIRQAPRDRRLGVEHLSRHEQLLRARRTEVGDHERHGPPAHRHSALNLRHPEAQVVGRDS
jgi:hypothetical protein